MRAPQAKRNFELGLPFTLVSGLACGCARYSDSNIFENIEGPAHFHIREYSREYRCPGRLFPQEYTSFPQPLTLVDLESKDILEYS